MIAGPGLGGALIAGYRGGADDPPRRRVLSLFLRLPASPALCRAAPVVLAEETVGGAIRAGFKEVAGNPYLRTLTLASCCVTTVYSVGSAMLVPYASRELGLGSAAIGIALATMGVGSIAGTLLAGPIVARAGVGPGLMFGLAASIPGMLIAASAGGGAWLAATLLIGGLFATMVTSPVFSITQFSLRQVVTPDPLRGRVVSVTRVAIRGCAALGALAGGVVAEVAGLRAALFIATCSPILPLLIIWRSPVAALKHMPASPRSAMPEFGQ